MFTPPAPICLLPLMVILAASPVHSAETANVPNASLTEQAKAVGTKVKQDARAVGKAVQDEAKAVGKAAKKQAKRVKAEVKALTAKTPEAKPE